METKTIKVFRTKALYVRKADVRPKDIEALKGAYTFEFYKDSACEGCEYFHERPCDICEECPANLGRYHLAHDVLVKGVPYLSLPAGDAAGVRKALANYDVRIINKCPEIPMRRPIKFLGSLRDHQVPAVKALVKNKRGVLEAPPRSGKTIVGAYTACRLGLKTIIVAAQRDWLVNFYETFCGSETQKPLTDVKPSRIGFAKKLEDFEKYDVALCTYQTFLSDKGRQLLKKVGKMFSVLIVDEIHYGAATAHARVLRAFTVKYAFGLSGTPDRKDGRYLLVDKIMGPVVHRSVVEQLRPEITFVDTGLKTTHDYKHWTYFVRFIETNPKRLKLIAEWALKDVKAGHLVLIPFTRVDTIRALTAAINQMAGRTIAASFYGGSPKAVRDETIQKARDYKIKVVVGNIRLLSTGINIPRASCLYEVTPSSNLPKAQQRFSRILTLWDDKPTPMIRVFADDLNRRRTCFRAEFWGCLWKIYRPRIAPDVKERLFAWMNAKTRKGSSGAYSGGLGGQL